MDAASTASHSRDSDVGACDCCYRLTSTPCASAPWRSDQRVHRADSRHKTKSWTPIYAMPVTYADSNCGCCFCCQGSTSHITREWRHTLPHQLNDIYTLEEWELLTARIDQVMKTTMPHVCPFCCLCLPWYWVVECMMDCCLHRNEKLRAVLNEENVRLAQQGVRWKGQEWENNFVLEYMSEERRRFEEDNPTRRKITQEQPYGLSLYEEELNFGSLAMAMQMMRGTNPLFVQHPPHHPNHRQQQQQQDPGLVYSAPL